MPTVGFVEKTIFCKEGIDIDFMKEGKNVRSEVKLPYNYKSERKTKGTVNITTFKEKLKSQFPGYDFKVNDEEGNEPHGNTLVSSLRAAYKE